MSLLKRSERLDMTVTTLRHSPRGYASVLTQYEARWQRRRSQRCALSFSSTGGKIQIGSTQAHSVVVVNGWGVVVVALSKTTKIRSNREKFRSSRIKFRGGQLARKPSIVLFGSDGQWQKTATATNPAPDKCSSVSPHPAQVFPPPQFPLANRAYRGTALRFRSSCRDSDFPVSGFENSVSKQSQKRLLRPLRAKDAVFVFLTHRFCKATIACKLSLHFVSQFTACRCEELSHRANVAHPCFSLAFRFGDGELFVSATSSTTKFSTQT